MIRRALSRLYHKYEINFDIPARGDLPSVNRINFPQRAMDAGLVVVDNFAVELSTFAFETEN